MPRVGFEPTIAVLERANKVYALDRAASVIGFEKVKLFLSQTLDTHKIVRRQGSHIF
jgi:hypothetical protein